MLHEYALDPGLITNWKDFRYFVENFGISKGRLISRYPKHWKRLVYESLNGCGDVERKRIVEALTRIDIKLLARSNQWDETLDWLLNTEAEHLRNPFHAIIARANPNKNTAILIGDTIDDNTPLWKSETQEDIDRNASTMAACIATLLRSCRELIFVDPHFGPENSRHRRPLLAFLETALKDRTTPLIRVEYHALEKSQFDFFSKECNDRLPAFIPNGLEVRFKRWKTNPGGDLFHDRFILTDLGGVEFTVGLDIGNKGEKTKVHILSDSSFLATWNKHVSSNPAYTFVDEVIVKGTR